MLNSIMEPALNWLDVTASDSNLLAQVNGRYPRAIWVGTSGDLALEDEAGNQATFKGAYGLITVQPLKVLSTGTTASDIIAIY